MSRHTTLKYFKNLNLWRVRNRRVKIKRMHNQRKVDFFRQGSLVFARNRTVVKIIYAHLSTAQAFAIFATTTFFLSFFVVYFVFFTATVILIGYFNFRNRRITIPDNI
jgi:hypothetical protein